MPAKYPTTADCVRCHKDSTWSRLMKGKAKDPTQCPACGSWSSYTEITPLVLRNCCLDCGHRFIHTTPDGAKPRDRDLRTVDIEEREAYWAKITAKDRKRLERAERKREAPKRRARKRRGINWYNVYIIAMIILALIGACSIYGRHNALRREGAKRAEVYAACERYNSETRSYNESLILEAQSSGANGREIRALVKHAWLSYKDCRALTARMR